MIKMIAKDNHNSAQEFTYWSFQNNVVFPGIKEYSQSTTHVVYAVFCKHSSQALQKLDNEKREDVS